MCKRNMFMIKDKFKKYPRSVQKSVGVVTRTTSYLKYPCYIGSSHINIFNKSYMFHMTQNVL